MGPAFFKSVIGCFGALKIPLAGVRDCCCQRDKVQEQETTKRVGSAVRGLVYCCLLLTIHVLFMLCPGKQETVSLARQHLVPKQGCHP